MFARFLHEIFICPSCSKDKRIHGRAIFVLHFFISRAAPFSTTHSPSESTSSCSPSPRRLFTKHCPIHHPTRLATSLPITHGLLHWLCQRPLQPPPLTSSTDLAFLNCTPLVRERLPQR
jgi:hypothetical protein